MPVTSTAGTRLGSIPCRRSNDRKDSAMPIFPPDLCGIGRDGNVGVPALMFDSWANLGNLGGWTLRSLAQAPNGWIYGVGTDGISAAASTPSGSIPALTAGRSTALPSTARAVPGVWAPRAMSAAGTTPDGLISDGPWAAGTWPGSTTRRLRSEGGVDRWCRKRRHGHLGIGRFRPRLMHWLRLIIDSDPLCLAWLQWGPMLR